MATETVDLLDGRKAGDLDVVARGHGQDRVQLSIRNRSTHRLNVVVPPGLVAASAVGQPGRRGRRRGCRASGWARSPIARGPSANSAGRRRPAACSRSVPANDAIANQVAVPVGETVDLTIPGVCLNYGLPTPTPRNTFRLVDVDEYSSNPRVRRALRSLATYGTSHGVAQAVMWNVCNDLPFEQMAEQTGKVMNIHEIALAARFVEALDASSVERAGRPGRSFPRRASSSRCEDRAHSAAEAKRLAGRARRAAHPGPAASSR